MPRIQLFGLGLQSRSRAVTAKYRQNFYTENRPQGEKSQVVAYGTPGTLLFADLGGSSSRGGIVVERVDLAYVVNLGTFYEVNNAGVATARGTIGTTSGRVSLAHNGSIVMVVDGDTVYTYDTTAPATPIAETSTNAISNPNTCTWMDGYFVINNTTQGQISTNGSTWDATEVFTPESNPDNFIHVIADHGQLLCFSDLSIEPWNNTGATDFPFAPIVSAAAEWGLAARWSLVKFNDSVAFLAKNRMGQVVVSVMQGNVPVKISTPDIDEIINDYTTVSDASAFSYLLGGHAFYQINFPSADASWLYDALTGQWQAVKSYGMGRHRGDWALNYLNKTIVAASDSGRHFILDPDVYTDNGDMIEGELISENIASQDSARFNVDRLRIEMETGVGLATGQGSDPTLMLFVSRNGGATYGNQIDLSIGQIGDYKKRVEARRLGYADEWNFKLRITDPVKRVITEACVNPSD